MTTSSFFPVMSSPRDTQIPWHLLHSTCFPQKHGTKCWWGCDVFAYAAVLVPAVLTVVTAASSRPALHCFTPPRLFPLVPASVCEWQVLKDRLLVKVCLCVSMSDKQTRTCSHTSQRGSVRRIGNVTTGLLELILPWSSSHPLQYSSPHIPFGLIHLLTNTKIS